MTDAFTVQVSSIPFLVWYLDSKILSDYFCSTFFSSVKRFCILCFSLIFTTLDNFLSVSIVLQLSDKRFRIDIGQGGFLGRIQNLVICVRFRSLLSCIFLQFLMGDVFPISEPSVITYLFLKWIFDENANAILLLEMKWTDHSR